MKENALNASALIEFSRANQLPAYIYDRRQIERRIQHFLKCKPENSSIHFALKANNNREVLKIMSQAGLGADVVSLGEMNRALECGFKPEQIVFSGVGKSKHEIEAALRLGILQLNIESLPELLRLISLAKKLGKKAHVAIRVNPDMPIHTHPYIQTGFRENKFGVDITELPEFVSLCVNNPDAVDLQGVTMHIGSQLFDLPVIGQAMQKLCDIFDEINSRVPSLRYLDFGGGLGVDYTKFSEEQDEARIAEYFHMVKKLAQNSRAKRILFEPGRALIARAGLLVTQIEYVKKTPYKNFLIVNTGMHHFMRPALYQAEHKVWPLTCGLKPVGLLKSEEFKNYDVVGPICESADVLVRSCRLPANLVEGDLLIISDVGAYGKTMSSSYNLQSDIEEYVLDGVIQ
jgi:diaminopimelate decarboxylase